MDNHHAKNLARCVFFISDGTAITAETLGHAVLSQFPLHFLLTHYRLSPLKNVPQK